MGGLLKLSAAIDRLNEIVGRTVYWLVLVVVLISATNAIIRKLFNSSSNAWLEWQWYLFGVIFLLCSGYALLRQEHIRIDECRLHKLHHGFLKFIIRLQVTGCIGEYDLVLIFINNTQDTVTRGLLFRGNN